MRKPRETSIANTYHIIVKGTGRQLIFEDDGDRERFLQLLDHYAIIFKCSVYAWCLMGNHVHLIIVAPLEVIAYLMKCLCGTYAQWFNKKTGRVGHLFQERYKCKPINDDSYLLTSIRYVHANPDKAGIARFDKYRWSSYHEYTGTPVRCSVGFPLEVFGGIDEFIAFHRQEDKCIRFVEGDYEDASPKRYSDEEALSFSKGVLGGLPPSEVKAQKKELRRTLLRKLKSSGLSVRQIERLTGIGKSTIART